ncbi:hypothetical protein F7734_05000 [Scytonema sp. UIC 10036]|uniref:hypothetical protein n=1 Tax=Scytonema sp. UIC 10036 TaxID=2304196 RepID=UPI0012DADC58|nr:hypothetical protein [Scytonema sp. UIC 10036]MUG91864.1 hypothetical protein [Scytonema sp. UIC 10036]
MKDMLLNQEGFVRDRIPTRLKNLATHLKQIGSLSLDATQGTATAELIRESLYFIEWTAPDMEIDPAYELVELGRTLARWSFHWDKIWSDTTARNQVAHEANSLSQQVLEMSGLLGAAS